MPVFHEERVRLLPFAALLAQGCVPPVVEQVDGTTTEGSSTTADPTTVGTVTTNTTTTTGVTTRADTTAADSSTTATSSTDVDPSATDSSSTGTTDASGTTGTETSDTEDVPLPACPGVGLGSVAVGDACTANADCVSALCTIYTDAPLNLDAVCDVPPLDCSLRITGTSLDMVTRQPLAGYELRLASALQAATNPVGAMAFVEATSGADGRIDAVTAGPPMTPIGLVALLEGPGFHLTATPVVAAFEGTADYGVATEVHDLWLVPDDAVAAWSAELALDPAIAPEDLPLGASGGVVGLVRDAAGVPLAGATVGSLAAGSVAIVRYLNDDGTFGTAATGSQGLFVILDPSLAEQFGAELAGVPVGGPVTVISANDAIFTATFIAP